MSQPKPAPRSRHPISWAVVTVLIVLPFVAMLWVPSYARSAPKAGGFPFFYWYQLLWVPIVAVTSVTAWLLVKRTRRDRVPPAHRSRPGPGSGADGNSGTETTS